MNIKGCKEKQIGGRQLNEKLENGHSKGKSMGEPLIVPSLSPENPFI